MMRGGLISGALAFVLWIGASGGAYAVEQNVASLEELLGRSKTEAMLQIRREKADDPHRPHYHFLPPHNWMNDPNGLLHWQGVYHLFYQYNPYGAVWGNMTWGHAVSFDLVHWHDLPYALERDPDGPDHEGVFSGTALIHEGRPWLFYTGVWPEVQCVAEYAGLPDGFEAEEFPEHGRLLVNWDKHDANPVIAAPPEGFDLTGPPDFRDPFPWKEGEHWYVVVGSGIKDVGGVAFLYRSTDLIEWEYLHPLVIGDKDESGALWECPNFFSLGDKHVLIVSYGRPYYYIGEYRDQKFHPESFHALENSGCAYAPQVFKDELGRWLMFSWLRETRSQEAQVEAGWSGVQSIPVELTLGEDNLLRFTPAPELETLRAQHVRYQNVMTPEPLDAVEMNMELEGNGAYEVILEAQLHETGQVGLVVQASPRSENNGARDEFTRVYYDAGEGQLVIDRAHSSLSENVDKRTVAAPLALAEGEAVRLRVFVDRSVIEVFANERVYLASRVYPSLKESTELAVFYEGGEAGIQRVDAWTLASIWENASLVWDQF